MTNANKAIPEVEITLNGEKKTLFFSTAAFCILEKETGTNTLLDSVWSNLDTSKLTALLWAALLHSEPDLKLEDLRKSIGMAELGRVSNEILTAFKNASPEEKKSVEESDPASQREPIRD